MASDQVIGGVNGPAFTIANLPAHSTITLNINGQIQGRTSDDAVVSDEALDIISTGEIAGGLSEGVDVQAASITFVISSTGKVLAGGGNGGTGGTGGKGDDVSWTDNRAWQDNVYEYVINGQYPDGSYDQYPSYYAGVNLGVNYHPQIYNRFGSSSKMYAYGVQYIGGFYGIRRGDYSVGNTPSGGAGGLGAGYNQARTDGVNGVTGTNRSGNGGQGGHGGDWGVAGADGQRGGTGLYYSSTSDRATRSGSNGTSGLGAGMSFYLSTSTVRYFGIDSPQAKALGL
jgi:hypothetical protein